ncbi:MAG TPA: hypothetical protein VF026_24595 [Ktedonobacteraceae bacterium]
MKTSLAQTNAPSRRRLRSFTGSVFGWHWAISIWPRRIVWEEKLDDLPEAVGTQEIDLPAQSVHLKFDFEHVYLTGADNRPARCRIRVYSPVSAMLQSIGQAVPGLISPISYSPQEPTVVLCEPIAISGITNRAEDIATAVWHQLSRPGQFTWIEHWWTSNTPISREFLCVRFRVNAHGILVDPRWTEMSRSAVEQLIGPVEEIQRTKAGEE